MNVVKCHSPAGVSDNAFDLNSCVLWMTQPRTWVFKKAHFIFCVTSCTWNTLLYYIYFFSENFTSRKLFVSPGSSMFSVWAGQWRFYQSKLLLNSGLGKETILRKVVLSFMPSLYESQVVKTLQFSVVFSDCVWRWYVFTFLLCMRKFLSLSKRTCPT